MRSLQGFSDAATPVFSDLGKAAPSFTDATRTLTPFSEATTVALKSLGDAGEASGPIFARSRPGRAQGAQNWPRAVSSRRPNWPGSSPACEKTGGWDGLVELIYNTAATFNGFDQYGHFGRTLVTLTNCLDYEPSSGGSIRLRRPLHRSQRQRHDRRKRQLRGAVRFAVPPPRP